MNDLRANSPSPDRYFDGMNSLTMREKSLLKRSVSKHHNNNFKAGYVPVHEQYLHKTGIRGRKTFAFWALVGLLFMLACGNFILTTTILGVLRLGQGMQSLELVPEYSSIKFFGDADLGHVYKRDGKLEGFVDVPLEISSHNGSILINLSSNGRSVNRLKMVKNGTVFKKTNKFDIKNADGKTIFSTNSPTFNVVTPVKNLNTQSIQTNRIVSPMGDDLEIVAKSINLKGSEGTEIEGKEILLSADQDVYLKSINGSIIISGKEGTYLDMKKIPIALPNQSGEYVTAQYKVCVCMPQGKLFRIPVPRDPKLKVYCNHINYSPQHNPCI